MRLVASAVIMLVFTFHLSSQCPELVWSDEFEGNSLNSANWDHMLGDGCSIGLCGWGNNEFQYYTPNNTEVSDGTLKIYAKKESIGGKSYTSSRIRSKGKVDIKYGRIESRMKMPVGQGLWPAFWMLPTDEVYGGWPQSGEIDIMEYLGQNPKEIHGTLHFGQPWPNNSQSTSNFILQNRSFDEGFHDFAIEWKENEIRWFVDGYLYAIKTTSNVNPNTWPFNERFHFLLNFAVGGNWPGNPGSNIVFPQTFEIDYIRVYDMVGNVHLTGDQEVENKAQNVKYSVARSKEGSTFNWSIPEDAEIVGATDGQEITVNFGDISGPVQVVVTDECTVNTLSIEVRVFPVLSANLILENYDNASSINYAFSTGDYFDNTANPAKNDVNSSDLCGEYRRNSSSQYDVLVYTTSALTDVTDFVTGDSKFSIDIRTNAPLSPVAPTVLLQLENSNLATDSNYPTGRHSRYSAVITEQNEWHTLKFDFLDRPDGNVSNTSVNEIILLFAPNSSNASTYFIDNFLVLSSETVNTKELTLSQKNERISIAPNPVNDILTLVSNDQSALGKVQIFNNVGALQMNFNNIGDNLLMIDISSLSNGIYYLKTYQTNGNTSIIKVLKH